MFELKLADDDVTGGSIPVTWCADQELLKKLADNDVRDPYVVIVVAPDGPGYHSSKEVRKVVPLKDLMTYVDFRVAGKNKIFGFVSFKGAHAKTTYLSRRDGVFDTDILNHNGSDFVDFSSNTYKEFGTTEPILIDVPADLFAEEPAHWEKAWVNHWFSSKSPDQCSFRRRRLLAYTIQPFVILLQTLAKLGITLLAILFGARGLTIDPLLHPLASGVDDCWAMFKPGTIFIRHLPEDDDSRHTPNGVASIVSYAVRSFWSLPFMPLILIPLVLLAVFHLKGLLFGAAIAYIILLVLVLGLGLLTGTGSFIIDGIKSLIPARKEEVEPLWYLDAAEIGDIVCTVDKKPFSYKTLPSKKKSIRLRFQNLKSKVCRPFSA